MTLCTPASKDHSEDGTSDSIWPRLGETQARVSYGANICLGRLLQQCTHITTYCCCFDQRSKFFCLHPEHLKVSGTPRTSDHHSTYTCRRRRLLGAPYSSWMTRDRTLRSRIFWPRCESNYHSSQVILGGTSMSLSTLFTPTEVKLILAIDCTSRRRTVSGPSFRSKKPRLIPALSKADQSRFLQAPGYSLHPRRDELLEACRYKCASHFHFCMSPQE